MNDNSRQFVIALAIFEVIFIILFGFFVRYDEDWTDEQLNRNQFSCIILMIPIGCNIIGTKVVLKSRVQGHGSRLS